MRAYWDGLSDERRGALLTVADQGLNSASNFLLGIVVARAVTIQGYGAFAIGFSVYGVFLGVSRAFGTDALLVRHSASNLPTQRHAARAALGAAIATGLVVGLVLVVAGFVAGGTVGGVCIAFGVALPGLFAHEGYRHVFIMERTPELAALIDAVWLGTFIAFLLLPGLRGAADPVPFILGWALAAVAAVVVAILRSETDPRLERARSWAREHRDLGPRFALEWVVASSSSHVVVYAAGLIAGLATSAALRGAYVVMGPVWILGSGLVAAAVPAGVRLRQRSLADLRLRTAQLAVFLAAVSVAWGLLTASLPTGIGEAALGDTWVLTQPLLGPMGVYGAGFVATTGLIVGLRSLAAARRSFVAAVPTGLLVIAAGVAGAVLGDARTVIMAMIPPTWLTVVVVADQFRRALREAAEMAGDRAGGTA